MIAADPGLPRVRLTRAQSVRLAVVFALAILAIARVVPDFVRAVYPLRTFAYATDGDGVVISAPPHGALRVGDRVRIDRIPAFDRKPGIAGVPYTYDNPGRRLPIARRGRERVLRLDAAAEGPAGRALAVFRIVLFLAAVALAGLLFLVKPGIATAAFFVFCLGAQAPATYLDLVTPNPWRPLPIWIADTLHGLAAAALLLFAFCLIDGDTDRPASASPPRSPASPACCSVRCWRTPSGAATSRRSRRSRCSGPTRPRRRRSASSRSPRSSSPGCARAARSARARR